MFGSNKVSFKTRKIRNESSDYIRAFMFAKKTVVSFVTLASLALITVSNGLITSAAPTGEPPTGNITPTFSSVKTQSLILTDDLTPGSTPLGEISAERNFLNNIPYINFNLGDAASNFSIDSRHVRLNGDLNQIRNRVELSDTFNFEPGRLSINTPNQNTSQTAGSGMITFESYKLHSFAFPRGRDGNTINRFISCPSFIDSGENRTGQDYVYTGKALACSYYASGNNRQISDNNRVAQSLINDTGSSGCHYDMEAYPMTSAQLDVYGSSSTIYGKMICYYGTTPKGEPNYDIGL